MKREMNMVTGEWGPCVPEVASPADASRETDCRMELPRLMERVEEVPSRRFPVKVPLGEEEPPMGKNPLVLH